MKKNERIDSLDSVRGLASMSVVLLHCLLPIPLIYSMVSLSNTGELNTKEIPEVLAFIFTYSPLHIIWDGGAAVILFFVLSGFVLSLPIFLGRTFSYSNYIIKRFCRIYIPYIVSLFFAFALLSIFKNSSSISQLSDNFNSLWQAPITFKTVIDHIFMIGDTSGSGANVLNGVIWTLVHEMRISIVLPILIFIIARLSWKYAIITPFAIFIISRFLLNTVPESDFINGLYNSLYYSSFFAMGILVSKYLPNIKNFYSRMNVVQKVLVIVIALLLYSWQWTLGFYFSIGSYRIAQVISGLGAALIISITLSSGLFQKILTKSPLIWLGKISFSLYLVHSPILLALLYSLYGKIPLLIILISVPIVSLIVASLFFKYVETPSMILGKNLASKWKSKKMSSKHLNSK